MKSVLKGYPHLIQIFADFLSPEEAIAEGVVSAEGRCVCTCSSNQLISSASVEGQS